MDKVSEIAERIVCGGNLSRLDNNGVCSMGEVAARELHDSLLKSARFLSNQGKGRGRLVGVDDYMEVLFDSAFKELNKLKNRY